jgi:hypothetical protein
MLESYNGSSGVATVPLGECLPVGILPALIGHRTCRALFMSGFAQVGHGSSRAWFVLDMVRPEHRSYRAWSLSGFALFGQGTTRALYTSAAELMTCA